MTRAYGLIGNGLLTILLGLGIRSALAEETGDGKTSVRADDAIVHRPTAVPDRIILTWKADPATTQAVTWRTDDTVTAAVAEIAEAGAGPKFTKDARRIEAQTTPLATDLGTRHYHTAEFTGLKPQTLYAYRVGDGVNWSEWFHFHTASERPEPYSFIYFGDAQTEVKSLWSRVIREAYATVPQARFLLHAGDLINNANRDAQWGEWFAAGGWVNGMIPTIATPGNHEYDRHPSFPLVRELSRHWRPQFAFPENGPADMLETVYWIDYQGVRIISLNSNLPPQGQVQWLESVLSKNPNRWTVITFHHPVYSTARGRDNPLIRRVWQPIFDRYQVDLVLQGHDHGYGRTGLIYDAVNIPTGAQARDMKRGTVYVVSVSGPKMYEVQREDYMRRAAQDSQLFQIITIDGDELRYSALLATGELYDAFTLRKKEGQPNELIDQAPETPERLSATK